MELGTRARAAAHQVPQATEVVIGKREGQGELEQWTQDSNPFGSLHCRGEFTGEGQTPGEAKDAAQCNARHPMSYRGECNKGEFVMCPTVQAKDIR